MVLPPSPCNDTNDYKVRAHDDMKALHKQEKEAAAFRRGVLCFVLVAILAAILVPTWWVVWSPRGGERVAMVVVD